MDQNLLNTLNYLQKRCTDKLEYFNVEPIHRPKRGAMNFIGTGFNWLFGTLGANDKEIYDNAITEMNKNQLKITQNFQDLWSINIKAMTKINESLENSFFNEQLLRNYSSNTNQEIKKINMDFNLEILINQYQIILDIVNELENSISFCKVHTLHPSIIPGMTLIESLKNLNLEHKLAISPSFETLFIFEQTIDITCGFNSESILYFINVPLYDTIVYPLIKLIPIPFMYDHKYLSVLLSEESIIKINETIVGLSGCVTYGERLHLCNADKSPKLPCETGLLLNNDLQNCEIAMLSPNDGIQKLKDHQRFLIQGFEGISFEKQCQDLKETVYLRGLFLAELHGCHIYFKGQEMKDDQNSSSVITIPHVSLRSPVNLPTPQLKSLGFQINNVTTLQIEPVELKMFNDTYERFIIIILLVLVLILSFIILVYYLKLKYCTRPRPISMPSSIELKVPKSNFMDLPDFDALKRSNP